MVTCFWLTLSTGYFSRHEGILIPRYFIICVPIRYLEMWTWMSHFRGNRFWPGPNKLEQCNMVTKVVSLHKKFWSSGDYCSLACHICLCFLWFHPGQKRFCPKSRDNFPRQLFVQVLSQPQTQNPIYQTRQSQSFVQMTVSQAFWHLSHPPLSKRTEWMYISLLNMRMYLGIIYFPLPKFKVLLIC